MTRGIKSRGAPVRSSTRQGRVAPGQQRQRSWQARRRRAFHRAQAQDTARPGFVQRLARLAGERQQAIGVAQQHGAGRRELQAPPFAHEEFDAKVFLELAHARRDVGLDAMQLVGGARDAARADDGPEDMQVRELHISFRDDIHLNNSFFRNAILHRLASIGNTHRGEDDEREGRIRAAHRSPAGARSPAGRTAGTARRALAERARCGWFKVSNACRRRLRAFGIAEA